MAVRREKVELILEDRFSGGIAKASAEVRILNEEVDRLSSQAVQTSRTSRKLNKDIGDVGPSARSTGKEIDQLSGRLRILGELVAAVGPAAVPIGALGIPALSGLASATGFATIAVGASALAFRGLGDVLDLVNKARLEPTVENLDAARVAVGNLTPEIRGFVGEIQDFLPALDHLSKVAAAGLFPGLGEGLSGLQATLPRIEKVVSAITTAVGDMASDAGASLAGGDWEEFFTFIETEGPAAIGDMSTALGNLTHGLAGLWMATQPINNDFMSWLVEATDDFDRWANGLDQTQGFEEFVAYIRENGPQVGETLGAMADALLEIVEAAAPLGGPVLQVLEALAKTVAAIADSPLGTPLMAAVTAMSALSLATRGYGAIQAATFGSAGLARIRGTVTALTTVTTAQQRATMSAQALQAAEAKRNATARAGVGQIGKQAAVLAGLALVGSGAADKIGLTNTTSLALAGTMAGPWGAAIGAGAGALLDAKAASDGFNDSLKNLDLATKSGDAQVFAAALSEVARTANDLGNSTGPKDWLGDQFGNLTGGDLTNKLTGIASSINFTNPLAALNIGSNPYGDDGEERAKLAAAQAQTQFKEAAKSAALLEKNTRDVAAAQAQQAQRSLLQAEALKAARQAANQTNQSFLNYSGTLGDTKKSFREWVQSMRDEAKALSNFAANTAEALDKGLSPKAIQYLQSQGPEGALRLQQALTGNSAQAKAKIEELNSAWRGFGRASKQNRAAVVDVQQEINTAANLAREAASKRYMLRMDANTDPARAALNRLLASYRGMRINIPVTTTTNANLADAAANSGKKGHSGGGYTGRGGKYEPAGVVHRREFVFSSEATDGNERFLDGLHRSLRGYAGGGMVGGSPFQAYIKNDLDLKLPNTLKEWQKALQRSTTVIEKETSKRDDLVNRRNDLKSSVAGGFQSDIFGAEKPSNWAYMSQADQNRFLTQRPMDILKGDTANANKFQDLLEVLATKKGLDGPAFEALARTNDLARAQAFAGQTPAQIAAFEKAFGDRSRAATAVGAYAGDVRYSGQIAETNDHLKFMREQNQKLEKKVESLEKTVKKAAKEHARDINRGRKENKSDLIQQLAND